MLHRRRPRLLVLCFHNVTATWCLPGAQDGARAFARQMRMLKRIANVVPLEESLDALSRGRALPPRAVAMTFDDGYRDNLSTAAPILRDLALPATFYLVPGFLGGSAEAWWERLGWGLTRARAPWVDVADRRFPLGDEDARRRAQRAIEVAVKSETHERRCEIVEEVVGQVEPDGPPDPFDGLFMDWDDARALVASGMQVGSHTTEHAILARESEPAQRADVADSRRALQDALEIAANGLAYPNGGTADFDAATVRAVRDAGHTHAVWRCAAG